MIYSSYMIMKHYACLICTYNLIIQSTAVSLISPGIS